MSSMLPKVDFISISLHGGEELFVKSDNPHIAQSGETDFLPYEAISNFDILDESPKPMNVEVIVMVQVPFGLSLNNIYSSFYKNDFSKYLKVKIVQIADPAITAAISSNPFEYIKPGGVFHEINSATVTSLVKEFTEFDGEQPEKTEQYANSIEVKHDSSGNKVYCFPYKFSFQVPEIIGGTKIDHLTYFSYAYVDLASFAQDQDFLESNLLHQEFFQKMTVGKVSQQIVIQGGTTKSSNQVFYVTPTDAQGNLIPFPNLKDNMGNIVGKDYTEATLWTGAVHYHGPQNPGPNGYVGYMAGPGGNDMGPILSEVLISNNIVQDFRKIRDIQALNFDYSLFSNSWFNLDTAQSLQNNMKGITDLNYEDNPYTSQDVEEYVVKSISNSKNQSIFGELYTGMDGSGNTRFSFSFDTRQAIMQNTSFPGLASHLFETSTEDELNNILDRKLIKELKIYRHRVHAENQADPTKDMHEYVLNQDPKLVVSTADQESGVLLTKIEYAQEGSDPVGAIREIGIDLPLEAQYASSTIKFYTGTDLYTPTDGDYVFSIEVSMNDPIISWMEDKIVSLENILYGQETSLSYSDYSTESKADPTFFNIHTNRFTEHGINFLGVKYGTAFSYNKVYEFFSILDKFILLKNSKKKAELFAFLTTISSLQYGNPSGVDTAFRVMESMYKSVLNVYSSASKYKKPIDSQHVESQYAAGSNPSRSYKISHKFKTKISGKTNHLTGYDYLSFNDTATEDSQVFDGLRNLSQTQYEQRANLEVSKLFPEIPSPINQAEEENKSIGVYVEQKLLNPEDSVEFTKYGYLSPSLVNIAGASSKNLLNNGSMSTDLKDLNNAILNIIRHNSENTQDFDFPLGAVATGVGSKNPDSIIKPSSQNEVKYDIDSLLASSQTTISTRQGKDIVSSMVDPTSLLLTTIAEKIFKFLSEPVWAWEYYTNSNGMHKEFLKWSQSSGTNDSYKSSNSPLKRAPNHIKALLLHLDYLKKLQNPAFSALKNYLEMTKPEAFEYNVSQESASPLDPSDFLMTNPANSESKLVPKNKIIYQSPEFLSFFALNYKKIVKIEYLLGYNNGKINNPVWKEMTYDSWQILSSRSGNVICRIVPYEKELYGVKDYGFLKLPIYNRHFIINFGVKSASAPTIEPSSTPSEEVLVEGKRVTISANQTDSRSPSLGQTLPAYNPNRPENIGQRTVGSLSETQVVATTNQLDTDALTEPTGDEGQLSTNIQGDSGGNAPVSY